MKGEMREVRGKGIEWEELVIKVSRTIRDKDRRERERAWRTLTLPLRNLWVLEISRLVFVWVRTSPV